MASQNPRNPRRRARGGRARFRRAADSLEQLSEVELAQKQTRTGRRKGVIETIGKSKQRLQNALNQLKDLSDAIEQFEND